MGAKVSQVPEEREEERLPTPLLMPSCALGGGGRGEREEMAEVIVNSFGEAEVKRGADTGLRPTEMSQAASGTLGRPQVQQWRLWDTKRPGSLQSTLRAPQRSTDGDRQAEGGVG